VALHFGVSARVPGISSLSSTPLFASRRPLDEAQRHQCRSRGRTAASIGAPNYTICEDAQAQDRINRSPGRAGGRYTVRSRVADRRAARFLASTSPCRGITPVTRGALGALMGICDAEHHHLASVVQYS